MTKYPKFTLICATTCFVMAALGTKISLAYWASAVNGANANNNGTVNTGTWDRYTTGTAISTCSGLRSFLQSTTSSTYHLTTDLSCPTTNLTNSSKTFSGTFYGNGFTISDISITSGRVGLFYSLSGATIQNLILDNINIGTSSTYSRVNNYTGILAGRINGANTVIQKIRIYNSSAYCRNSYGIGAIAGYATRSTTISNVMLQNVKLDSSSSSCGGLIGRINGASLDISDIYVEGTMKATQGSGGLIGTVDNNSSNVVVVNRAVVYGTTNIQATSYYAGGIVGNNQRNSSSHQLTDIFFTGTLDSTSNRAGTISNNVAMNFTNAWSAQWDSSTIASYSSMTGASAPASNYINSISNLTEVWWNNSLPTIATSGRWIHDIATYLFELKPKV